MNLYLRDQLTVLNDVKARLRDTGSGRWPDTEVYRAINDTLLTWHSRVSVPVIYTVEGGWNSNTAEYTLPAYIDTKTMIPQMKRTVPYAYWGQVAVDDSQTWIDIPGWTVDPNDDGDWVLRFDLPPYSTEGRIIWYASNAPLPLTPPTTSGSTSSSSTTVLLGSNVDCWDSGYVKAGNEWIQYAGVTRGATTTLNNCVRGLDYGAAAATIDASTTVYWGIVMPRLDLYRVLIDQTMVYLHELYLTDASSRETQVHQQMVGYYQARIDKFWKTWMPQRRPRIVIDRRFATLE
jgi:hypothetical protein